MAQKMQDSSAVYHARLAGFSSTKKAGQWTEDIVAAAIAKAESGLNREAHNPVPPDNSYGLWQINMIGDLGPARRRQFGISSNEELFDARVNGKAAFQVFRDAGNSFRPWSTFTNGSYLRFIPDMVKAAKDAHEPDDDVPIDDYVGNVGDVLGSLGDVAAFISDTKNWQRVALFVGGGVLLIVGIFMLADESGVGGAAAKMALKAVPAGRVLS